MVTITYYLFEDNLNMLFYKLDNRHLASVSPYLHYRPGPVLPTNNCDLHGVTPMIPHDTILGKRSLSYGYIS